MQLMKQIAIIGLLLLGTTQLRAATFNVTDTADTSAINTIRWAINQANLTSELDTIELFAGQTFSPASALPPITAPVIINGNANTIQAQSNFTLLTLGPNSDGSTIQNLLLYSSVNGHGTGIAINSNNNTIQYCVIGTNWDNSTSVGFNRGIQISGYGNLIGGNINVISSNTNYGVYIASGGGNSICANIIGLNLHENVALGNGLAGVAINSNADNNTIGLPQTGQGNVISGNPTDGIQSEADHITIQNNTIGLNSANTTVWANGTGINLHANSNSLIGGNKTASEGNVISGNTYYGIQLSFSSGNTICGNVIGLNDLQDTLRGNGSMGIYIINSNYNYIGTTESGTDNVISGNEHGIYLHYSHSNQIKNNHIGLNQAGSLFGNLMDGIRLFESTSNLIGGNSTIGAGNIISGNGSVGVGLYTNCRGNTVAGNIIGLDASQSNDRGNGSHGIYSTNTGSGYNQIGLPESGWGNIIGGNDQYGIYFYGALGHNKVQNNLIGINASGVDFGHINGVYIAYESNNLIGGNSNAAEGNVISGNDGNGSNGRGVHIVNGTGNRICGNIIGLSPDQNTVLTNYTGITLVLANNTTIGEPATGWGNIIGGNFTGLVASDSSNVTIQNNIIGLNASSALMPNTYAFNLAQFNNSLIGGRLNSAHEERNIISGHTHGTLQFHTCTGNTVSGNYFNTSLDGLAVIANAGESAAIELYASGNNLIGGSTNDSANLYGNVINSLTKGILLRGAASTGNTVTGNFINWLTDGSVPASSMTSGIEITDDAFGNLIGYKKSGAGNLIAGVTNGIVIDGASSTGNQLYGNTITAFSSAGIALNNSGNNSLAAPVITSLYGTAISGTCAGGASTYIEFFRSEQSAGNGGSLVYLGYTETGSTTWSATIPSVGSEYVCAIATDSNGNSSAFSDNFQNTAPPPSATPTITVTSTITPTATVSPTITVTSSVTPTATEVELINQSFFNGKAAIAYPNPGKNKVTIAVKESLIGSVVVRIYNISGEKITELTIDETQKTEWNTSAVGPGIYLYQILANDTVQGTYKLAIVK